MQWRVCYQQAEALTLFTIKIGLFMDTKQLDQLTHRLMTKHNIKFDCGAQYSVKCQFAQLENIIRYMKEHQN